MSVSVVVPTYNRCTLLERALISVRQQTVSAEEVIVVDDGSTDGTREMVASRFPEVRLLSQSNQGVSAARNTGIREATGDWIALLDSDDEWLPEKLERQLGALEAEPKYDLCHCDEIWMRTGVRVNQALRHEKRGGFIYQHCLPLCAISPSAAVIRRTVFDQIGMFDEALPACEDYDYWLRFCSKRPVLYLPERLVVKHGGRDDQLSRVVEGLDQYRVRALARVLARGELGEDDVAATRRILGRKARIFAAGARKRGRDGEADAILDLAAANGALGEAEEGG